MDCEETDETQAAFVNDLGQIKASCGTKQLVQALTLLSETILSYAEGKVVIAATHVFESCVQQHLGLTLRLRPLEIPADTGTFEVHVTETANSYLLELLQQILQPGFVIHLSSIPVPAVLAEFYFCMADNVCLLQKRVKH